MAKGGKHGGGGKKGQNNNRSVFQRTDGKWANKRDSADKAASLHDTQKQAIDAAHKTLEREGGELIIHGRDGKIRSKDTIGKPDPNPPKDKEH